MQDRKGEHIISISVTENPTDLASPHNGIVMSSCYTTQTNKFLMFFFAIVSN